MVNLRTMEVGVALEDFDFIMSKSGAGPVIFLNDTTSAFNLGNEQSFDEQDEAPEEGYEQDSGPDLVIGAGYRSGGSGQAGFEMTYNVYALMLSHEEVTTFAKIMVTQARGGQMKILCFHQPDGSRDLSTQDSM